MPKATFLGTFSTRGIPGAGDGLPNPNDAKLYWFVWEDSIARSYLVQRLDKSFDPCESPQLLPPRMYRQYFTREPKVTIIPDIAPEVQDYLDKVFKPDSQAQVVSGKTAPPQAASGSSPSAAQVDRDMRAQFAKSIMRLRKGEKEGAAEIFRKLAKQEEGIVPAHKHMFTDFGMDLRKSKMHELALEHFARAVELSPADSHAHFNMARILYEVGDKDKALSHVNRALELEADLKYARILKQRILSNS